ncbi:hypothetical protein A2645_00085 [Candidatus Nomurabacteria bacterium RIFCSPHIGHO2_01_FULL_39_9]|uniref:Cell shape-determining protein MreC n=1 Tax=Candidatus Nomurabacteria bacterium RIFCSPHIGHO2_01_FULL_39_9 TaxID=1801735 RepID=A0A1F6UVM7_9BACT|nr:MAG: hypothetical protein A2645_00085 [Candidatus Nomurabacteria bacterium RIFCSPHIGHO2_01_FULL_39_9]
MNRYNKKSRLFIYFLSIVALVFIFFFFGSRILPKPIAFLAKPIWQLQNSLQKSFDNLNFLWQSKKSIIAENDRLKEQLEEYRQELVYAEFLKDENEKLNEILGKKINTLQTVLVPVLARPNQSIYDTLIVDIGTSQISVGDKVIVSPNILIGEIKEVLGQLAKVELYSTPGVITQVSLSDSGVSTSAIGRGGGNFKIVAPREVVVSIDESVKVAPDFLIGFIKKIESDPRIPEQTIYVASPVNIFTLQFVEIVISAK